MSGTTKRWLVFLWLLLFVGNASSVLAQTITLKSRVVSNQSQITLGMVAELTPSSEGLAQKRLVRAPNPAKKVVLKRAQIERLLRQNGVDTATITWAGPKTVNIVGASQTVTPSDVQYAIDDFLRDAEFRLPNITFEFIPFSLPEAFTFPAGSLQYDVIPAVETIVGSRSFTIVYRVGGKTVKNLAVRGRLSANAEVVVVQQPLRRGVVISSNDVELVAVDISKAHDPLFVLEDVIGQRVVRSMRAGQLVESKYIELPPVIKKGDFVRIIAQRGSMVLTASGVARQDGRMNETIRVKNSSSQKEVRGRVIGPSQVKVEF